MPGFMSWPNDILMLLLNCQNFSIFELILKEAVDYVFHEKHRYIMTCFHHLVTSKGWMNLNTIFP